ncbi:hypothetical protein [Fervidicoccus fontis]|uniref:Uncharacterized protein n=1 Tax=Fervidicoccus fontis TaxID=683846 RepID=A0A7C2ZQC5_9CREN|nr:hypothetical protein [Fervidicoccus fontis]HEW63672.1 hypothetical protein [Fervidicoccus fontis]
MDNMKKISLILLAIIPIVILALPIAVAQQGGATIISVTGTAPDGSAYPGEPVTVSLQINLPGTYTIKLASDSVGSNVWVTQTISPSTTGLYNVTLTLPKSLPGIQSSPVVYVLVSGFLTSEYSYLNIYPKVEISPIQTPCADTLGNPNSITVNVYGVDPNAVITAFNFTSNTFTAVYNLSTNLTVNSNGTASITLPLYGSSSNFTEGIPMGQYSVYFIGSGATYISNQKPGTFTVLPQLVLSPNTGNGIDQQLQNLTLIGIGFDPNVQVMNVTLHNKNFTNVSYTFDVSSGNIWTNSYGFFNFSNLYQYYPTNMTAGLYIPTVVESNGNNITFPDDYYLVQRILIIYYPSKAIVTPGQTITVVAYGYGPGTYYGYQPNYLTVTLDQSIYLGTFTLGKDGNLTFNVTMPPSNITFGAHYIWGKDSWGFEYRAAIVVGAGGYYEIINPITMQPKSSPIAYAGYNNQTVIVCPCEQYVGEKYCSQCAAVSGTCDYVGDKVLVVVTGLVPGDTINIYFGDIQVGTATADNSGSATFSFTVPTVPEGTYLLQAAGSSIGTITLGFYNGTNNGTNILPNKPVPVQVVPKILLLDLNKDIAPILVGSGIVRVIGTGFPAGVAIAGVLINNTDSIMAVTTNVQRWTSTSNGLLTSQFTNVLGLWIPFVEPGAYMVNLTYYVPSSTSTPVIQATDASYAYVINNLTEVATYSDLQNAVSTITSSINSAQSALSSQLTSVSTQLSNSLTTLQNNLNAAVGTINNALNGINSSLNTMSSQLSTLSNNVNSLSTSVNQLSSQVSQAVTAAQNAATSASSAATQAQNAATAASNAANQINALSSQVSNLGSQVSNAVSAANAATTQASDAASKAAYALYISLVTLILVLVALAISTMVYNTLKKSLATTPSK